MTPEPILLTAGEDPPRSITLSAPHHGTCECCGRPRDVTTLTTYRAGAQIHTGYPGGRQTVHTELVVADEDAIGQVDVCGRCVTGALAVRFAAAIDVAEAALETPETETEDQP